MRLLLITVALSLIFNESKVAGESCSVPEVNHGTIGKYTGHHNRFQEIRIGSKIDEKEELYLRCEYRYEVAGTPEKEEKILCNGGEWSSIPQCHPAESPYSPKHDTTSDKSPAETTILTPTRIPFNIPVSETSVSQNSESQSTLQPTCFCTYANFDKNLEAFVGTELLQNGSKVENGIAVKFFCQFFGHLRLQGPTEILCQECHWQTSKFPECAPPKTGETTVLINGDWKLLSGGTVAIEKGKTINIICEVKGVELIPQWINPGATNINVESYQDYYSGKNVSVLYILKIDIENTGKYQCFVPGNAPYNIYIEVITDGSTYNKKAESTSDELAAGRTGFLNTTENSAIETVQPPSIAVPSQTVSKDSKAALNVSNSFNSSCYCTYTNQDEAMVAFSGTDLLQYGSKVKNNSTVKFHCHQIRFARLKGLSEIKCQNCQWTSVEFPKCLQPQIVLCPRIPEMNGYSSMYTSDQNIGSVKFSTFCATCTDWVSLTTCGQAEVEGPIPMHRDITL
ncbi:uncharacterized protein TNCT_220142 [Trichonephila clavata]|uniref:Ig-like domain-containing protein n=1 Tax=Trichonephila clavata TaxID=2740835 RepID=A0A8X6GQA7_TRICU|nr:uncharacterized protein TNCT_220142 [Trichonephila clavata]